MGKMKQLAIETEEEREVFERMEKTVQFMSISVDDYLKLSEELAVARMLIRELGDRLAKLEKPWIGLTHGEVVDIYDQAIKADVAELVDNFARALETKLKEKNHD
jgi:hypothetical protein